MYHCYEAVIGQDVGKIGGLNGHWVVADQSCRQSDTQMDGYYQVR